MCALITLSVQVFNHRVLAGDWLLGEEEAEGEEYSEGKPFVIRPSSRPNPWDFALISVHRNVVEPPKECWASRGLQVTFAARDPISFDRA